MDEKIPIPDLTRGEARWARYNAERKRLWEENQSFAKRSIVHRDFDIRSVFEHLDVDPDLFLGYYLFDEAMYRCDFFEEWLENKKTRAQLNKIMRFLPSNDLEDVETESRGFWTEGERLGDKVIKRRIAIVKRYIGLPEAFELVAEYSGSSEAGRDLAEFGRLARRELGEFERFVRPMKETMQYKQKGCLDDEWANDCYSKMYGFRRLLHHLRDVKFRLTRYKKMCKPFELQINGQRIPICKPVFLDPDRRECRIKGAYNPLHFVFEKIEVGGRRKRVLTSLNVPNDVCIDDKHRHTYIYGPNSRGKSVYINTSALNMHLPMNGSYCFAESCEISFPGRLYPCFDLGDTVGHGHFATGGRKLDAMLDGVRIDDVVFLDEHAGGAEPDQEVLIARGITEALTRHRITFLHATNDRRVWRHKVGKGRTEVLQVAAYSDEENKFRVWPGFAKPGYSMEMAKEMRIDPESAYNRLAERFGK
ncbi:hypothetical protein HOC80_05555 [archaeon]|jgi:hypothetical protein|nr:hypothetical protein [archaeon]MBT4417539.1 hypothetical protein [archaeon]